MFIHIKKHLYLHPFSVALQAFAGGSTERDLNTSML